MAVTRRGYVFGAFVSSVFCVILIIVSVSSDSWVWIDKKYWLKKSVARRSSIGDVQSLPPLTKTEERMLQIVFEPGSTLGNSEQNVPLGVSIVVATAFTDDQAQDSTVRYGMFRGEFALHIFDTPSHNTLYMTCVPDQNACAVSCKTEASAREEEVRALAQGFRPNQACVSVTNVSEDNPLEQPPVLSFAMYISILAIHFLQLAAAVGAGALALLNATKNPTEPVFGLPGCLWANVLAAVLGVALMMMFGIYWASSGLRGHLAFSYIALGMLEASPALGFSYWVLLGSILCSITNIVLIQVRQYLLERDPPPPTLKVENHSDGTIFLY